MTLVTILAGTVLLLCLAYFIVMKAVKTDEMWMKIIGFSLAGLLVLAVIVTPVFVVAGRPMGGFGGRGDDRQMGMGRQMMEDRGGQERFGFGGRQGQDRGQCPNGEQFDGRQQQGQGRGFDQCPGSQPDQNWNRMPNRGQQPNQGGCPMPNPGQASQTPGQNPNQKSSPNQPNTQNTPTPRTLQINP